MVSLASTMVVDTLTPDEAALKRSKLRQTNVLGVTIAVVVLMAGWQLMSIYIRPWVPSPYDTALSMWKALNSPSFYVDMMLTWQRLLAAFVASTLIGMVLGIAIGLNRRIEAFFQPIIALALAVPDPVYIIFAALAVGTGELAGFLALSLAVTPFVVNVVRTSIHARDMSLDEMSSVYRLSRSSAFWNALVPQLVPALLTAGRFSFALSWKIVILVEALMHPQGIGASIYHSFNLLRMRDAIAVAIIFCVLMQLVERVAIGRLEKTLLRWRA